jgi:hypothetical protein
MEQRALFPLLCSVHINKLLHVPLWELGIRQGLKLTKTFSTFDSKLGSRVIKYRMKDETSRAYPLRLPREMHTTATCLHLALLSVGSFSPLSILCEGQLERRRDRLGK